MDSIRESIMKDIKATLEGVTVGAGYANTIASVQRFRQAGQSTLQVPCVFLIETTEEAADGPDPLITKHLTVVLYVVTRQDESTDSRSGDEVMNSLRADIEKAVLSTRTRGGYAIDTKPLGSEEMDLEVGGPDLKTQLHFEVMYRHQNTDPTAAT